MGRFFVFLLLFFFASFGNSQSRGVAILTHRHLQFRCTKEDGDEAGCVLLLLAEIQGKRIILAKVSASNIDEPIFSGQLENKLQDMEDYLTGR